MDCKISKGVFHSKKRKEKDFTTFLIFLLIFLVQILQYLDSYIVVSDLTRNS